MSPLDISLRTEKDGGTYAMFLSLPIELTQDVLRFCTPQAVAALSQTCRLAFTVVYGTEGQHVWREIFLSVPFDDLRDSPDYDPSVPIDWKTELQSRMRASSAIAFAPEDLPLSPERQGEVFQAFEALVKVAQSAIPPFRTDPDSPPAPSHNMRWLTDALARCALFYDPEGSVNFDGHSDHLERLLAYWGTPRRGVPTGSLHTKGRCFVYDLRHYTLESNWGVYRVAGIEHLDETRVRYTYEANWQHVKHCANTVLFGVSNLLCPPVGFDFIRAYSAPGSFDRKPDDWAGVEGVWVRYVCFMDYSDLAEFNWSRTNGPCDPEFFSKPGFIEVLRSIRVEIRLLEPWDTPTAIAPPPVNADPKYPRLHFKGTGVRNMVSGAQDDTSVNGHVDRYLDGAIQWTFVSQYGNVIWMFDGVQLGAVCSAAGVVGTWTSTQHRPGDPSGPSWMWKIDPQTVDEEE